MGNRTTQPVFCRVRQIPSGIDMTQGSQTQNMEAARLNPLLTLSTFIRFGTWNIKTMFEAGKAQQVANEIIRYNITLLGICEAR